MAIIPQNTQNLNPANMHGGPFTASTVGAVANGGNTQYGASGGSAASLAGKGLYSVSGGNGPSAVHKSMSGGARRRKHSRKHRHRHRRSSARSSRKYARKRSLKYRIKHRHSHSHSKRGGIGRGGQRGGYHQYMGNTPFTLGFRTPGFNLAPNMSALANPAPFMPYNSLTGGR
jgi:hypothetical protein